MSKYGKSVNNLFYTYSCLFVKNNNSMREFVSQKIFHCKPNLAKSRNLYSTSCADNLPCPCKKGQNKKKMRALNGRLPQNDRLDRRISHRRMTIALGMATTWQICWSRTSCQLMWCVCVRCLVGNVILVKQFCGVEASEQLGPCRVGEDHPDVCLYVRHAWPM